MVATETISMKWETIDRKWPHQVKITKPIQNLARAEMWLEDHYGSIGGRWNIFAYGQHAAVYYFKNEGDAIQFALIWK